MVEVKNNNWGGVNYSLSETLVGTWIDGKPLYQQTVSFGTLPNKTIKKVNHGISNIDNIVSYMGTEKGNNVFGTMAIDPNIINFWVSYTQIVVETGADASIYTAYITLQYTKTTD